MANQTPIHQLSILILVFLLLFTHGYSFNYLPPGVAPHDFYKGDILNVKVNKLASAKNDIPYSFYSIPSCRPHKIVNTVENLWEILRGDRIQSSPYQFQMRAVTACNIVCRLTVDAKTAKEIKQKIDDGYRANMILDDLPLVVAVNRTDPDSPPVHQLGYLVGVKVQYADTGNEKYFINNHISFIVKYHKNVETSAARIVGFEAKAFSVNHKFNDQWSRLITCDPHAKRMVTSSDSPQEVEDMKDIIFTYDVEFQESDTKWASRWDTYLLMTDNQTHWYPIVNSLINVVSICIIMAAVIFGTLRNRRISEYTQIETQEEMESRLVREPPVSSDLFCVYVGTGVQLFGTIVITVIFGVLGFLSPSNKGGFMIVLLVWALMGFFGGFAMARLYKALDGSERIKTTLKTAFMFPGIVFCTLFLLNTVVWSEELWEAVPFGTMLVLAVSWFGVSVPLVSIGSYIGLKGQETKESVETKEITTQIAEKTGYMKSVFWIIVGGIVPFGWLFKELFLMFTSIGLHHFYYVFGLLFVMLIVTCAEITICLCYDQLGRDNYRWWWRSYLTAGSSSFYLFIYATFYFFTKLGITELVPGILYFGYMLIASYAVFVLTGSIGFYACWWFTRFVHS